MYIHNYFNSPRIKLFSDLYLTKFLDRLFSKTVLSMYYSMYRSLEMKIENAEQIGSTTELLQIAKLFMSI